MIGNGRVLRMILAVLLLCAAAEARLTFETDPERVEQGSEFDFSLVIPTNELPESFNFPEIEYAEGTLEHVSSRTEDETRRDFFFGAFKVRKFTFRMKALRDGAHRVAVFWNIEGTRRALGSVTVAVRRNLDAPGLSARASVDRRSLWEGEQFTLTVHLNAYQNFLQLTGAAGLDFGSSFWGALDDDAGFAFERAKKPGDVVATARAQASLAPVKGGRLEIPSMRFTYMKQGRPERKVEEKKVGGMTMRSESIRQEPQEAVAVTAPVVVDVKPLPEEGRPMHFSGLVGNYTMNVKLSADSTRLGSPVTLEVKIAGDGRPGAAPRVRMPDLSEFRSVPPEENLSVSAGKGRKKTTWTGRWFLYPRRTGEFAIAPVVFSYFDPRAGSYRVLESPELKLKVGREAEAAVAEESADLSAPSGPAPANAPKREIKALGSDIRYIAVDGENLRDGERFAYRSPLWWLLLALGALLPLVLLGLRRLVRSFLSDPDRVRRSRARRGASAALRSAREALAAGNSGKFHDAVEEALRNALSQALRREPRGMTRAELAEALVARGLSGEQAAEALGVLDDCDRARFGGLAAREGSLPEELERAERALEALWRVRS